MCDHVPIGSHTITKVPQKYLFLFLIKYLDIVLTQSRCVECG
jgi:hypothetical protein